MIELIEKTATEVQVVPLEPDGSGPLAIWIKRNGRTIWLTVRDVGEVKAGDDVSRTWWSTPNPTPAHVKQALEQLLR